MGKIVPPVELPEVICDVCDKPVEYIEVSKRVDLCNSIEVYVKCHGDNDICIIDLREATIDLSSGRAFTTKKLEAPCLLLQG